MINFKESEPKPLTLEEERVLLIKEYEIAKANLEVEKLKIQNSPELDNNTEALALIKRIEDEIASIETNIAEVTATTE